MRAYYSKGGLREWVKQNWVDIANKNRMAHTRSVEEVVEKKEKLSKMRAYCKSKSDEQRAACGCRKKKQAKANTGPTPSRAATFAKKKKTA